MKIQQTQTRLEINTRGSFYALRRVITKVSCPIQRRKETARAYITGRFMRPVHSGDKGLRTNHHPSAMSHDCQYPMATSSSLRSGRAALEPILFNLTSQLRPRWGLLHPADWYHRMSPKILLGSPGPSRTLLLSDLCHFDGSG